MDVRNEVAKNEIVHVDFSEKPVRARKSLCVIFALRFNQKAFTACNGVTETSALGMMAKGVEPPPFTLSQRLVMAFTDSLERLKQGTLLPSHQQLDRIQGRR
jgi:hypothetical protein